MPRKLNRILHSLFAALSVEDRVERMVSNLRKIQRRGLIPGISWTVSGPKESKRLRGLLHSGFSADVPFNDYINTIVMFSNTRYGESRAEDIGRDDMMRLLSADGLAFPNSAFTRYLQLEMADKKRISGFDCDKAVRHVIMRPADDLPGLTITIDLAKYGSERRTVDLSHLGYNTWKRIDVLYPAGAFTASFVVKKLESVRLPSLEEFFRSPGGDVAKPFTVICKDGATVRIDGVIARLFVPLFADANLRNFESGADQYELRNYSKDTVEAVVRIVRSREITGRDAASPRVIELLYFLGIVHTHDWDQSLLWGLVCDRLTVGNCAQFLVLATLYNGGEAAVNAARDMFVSAIGSRYKPVLADEFSVTFHVVQRGRD